MESPPSPPVVNAQAVETCLAILEALAADRAPLAAVSPEVRRRLLMAAGRLSRPERQEQRALAKAFRRRDRDQLAAADEAVLEATGIRAARRAPVFVTPALPTANPAESPGEPPLLRDARKCYVCKSEYREVHAFYDQLCPPCAALNWRKRTQTADLRGKTALLTGGRVKIGYQAAIMLLRAGARVIVTTRFPRDAARRFSQEPDAAAWIERVAVHGLDLRHTPSVELFAEWLAAHEPRLDYIIHNACQTVRRPVAYYAHLDERENAPVAALPAVERVVLADHERLRAQIASAERARGFEAAALARTAVSADDRALAHRLDLFPTGLLDQDQQQVDLRDVNSWRLRLGEVSTVELLEVQLVNAVAPFVLTGRLKPLLMRDRDAHKHVVNVSAMEGQFYRDYKTDKHPHTNMAKAALNMLTRTSAQDLVRDRIYMNSVDTGWVTDEDPAAITTRKRAEHGFHPPLDIVDGAARIIDPIFEGVQTGTHVWGQFFKDYKPTAW